MNNKLNSTEEEEKLEKYLNKIAENLSYAILSYETLMTISKNREEIEKQNYSNFFFPLERILINDIILSLTKIFEKNTDSITLWKTLSYLECNQKKIVLKENFNQLLKKYNLFDFKDIKIENKTSFNELYKKDIQLEVFTEKSFINCLRKNINNLYTNYEPDLKALKNIRDQYIAHSDKTIIYNDKTTWNEILKLIDFVKEFIDLLFFVYFRKVYSSDLAESFEMNTSEAMKSNKCLLKILKRDL